MDNKWAKGWKKITIRRVHLKLLVFSKRYTKKQEELIVQSQDVWAAVICIVSSGFNSELVPTNALITMAENAVNSPKFKAKKFFAIAPKIFSEFWGSVINDRQMMKKKIFKNSVENKFIGKVGLNNYLRKNATKCAHLLNSRTILHALAKRKPFPKVVHFCKRESLIYIQFGFIPDSIKIWKFLKNWHSKSFCLLKVRCLPAYSSVKIRSDRSAWQVCLVWC